MPIGPVLVGLDVPLLPPDLLALRPVNELYKVLALQPQGTLQITETSIARSSPTDETTAFLAMAVELAPALTIAPEYSVPWRTLIDSLKSGVKPGKGCLWVLGCESLLLNGIDDVVRELAGAAVVVREEIDLGTRTTQEYLNPLAYIFEAEREDGEGSELVVLLQFKTEPSGDADNTEPRGMFRGTKVYLFGQNEGIRRIKLLTLICSDAFKFKDDLVADVADETLILHIQLNNKPCDAQYRAYRTKLFGFQTRTELICLNWAAGTNYIAREAGPKSLVTFNGSAWYRRPIATLLTDEGISENDAKGLYFTYDHDIRTEALHLTALPCALLFRSTKVFHHNVPAAASNLTGPQVESAFIWSSERKNWEISPIIDDGFADKVKEATPYLDGLEKAHQKQPINVDRIAAITLGKVDGDDWYKPLRLESLRLGDEDVVRRLTVGIDARSNEFREEHLSSVRTLAEIQAAGYKWPSEVEFLSKGFEIAWDEGQPHRNVTTAVNGKRKYATVVCLRSSSPAFLEKRDRQIRMAVAGKPQRPDEEMSDEERKIYEAKHYSSLRSVCVLYQKGAALVPLLDSYSNDIGRPAEGTEASFSDASFRRSTDVEK